MRGLTSSLLSILVRIPLSASLQYSSLLTSKIHKSSSFVNIVDSYSPPFQGAILRIWSGLGSVRRQRMRLTSMVRSSDGTKQITTSICWASSTVSTSRKNSSGRRFFGKCGLQFKSRTAHLASKVFRELTLKNANSTQSTLKWRPKWKISASGWNCKISKARTRAARGRPFPNFSGAYLEIQ